MKDENLHTIDWQLIRKKVDGMLSDEERVRLERWMAVSGERRKFVERACRYYEREIPRVGSQRVAAAWDRFVRGKRRKSRVMRGWWIGGLAASVLLCLGSWFLWFGVPEKTPLPVVENIQPGDSRAVLLLSDGQEIDLSVRDSVRVLTDNSASIRLDSATVVYDDRREEQKEVAYNTIRIPRGGEYNLVLADGTHVWLNSQSSLRFPVTFQGDERRVELTGEAYFDVTPGAKRFVVETGGMDVRVLGTAFNVNAYDDEAVVRTTLVREKVEIVSGENTMRVLNPGEQSVWDRSSGSVEVLRVNTSLYTRWKDGQFVFRDNTLEDIMRALARWYDMEYEFENQGRKQARFYGVIDRFEDVRGLLSQFEKTGKVKFEYQQKKVIIK